MDNFYKTVRGWAITKSEREWLRDTALFVEKQFPTKPIIVNIGVLYGATMHCLRAGAPSAQLFGVDIKLHSIYREKELNAIIIKGNSNACHVNFSLGIHFLFIDGGHEHSTVKADIVGWSPKIVVGGIIAFHDYSPTAADLRRRPHLEGIKKAVDEWITLEYDYWERLQMADSICAFKRIT